jgi:hypothetical protein
MGCIIEARVKAAVLQHPRNMKKWQAVGFYRKVQMRETGGRWMDSKTKASRAQEVRDRRRHKSNAERLKDNT